MEMLVHKHYIIPNLNKKKLKAQGFRYNREINSSDVEFYSLRFPIMKYNKFTTIEGEIIVDMENGKIKTNVYDMCTKKYYPPFYQEQCHPSNVLIIKQINKSFKDMFKKVGAITKNK